MRHITCTALVLACAGAIQAQSPNFGLSIFLSIPTGRFAEEKIPELIDEMRVTATDGYDIGLGGNFTMSFPLQKTLAFRVGFGGGSSRGTSTVPNEDTIFLRHTLFSLSGEFQIFFDDAYRHRGTYAIAGISGDFEKFERSWDDRWDDPPFVGNNSPLDVTRPSRLAGNFGLGHTFYGSDIKFTTEITYHTTFTNKDVNSVNYVPPADFIRISFGLVF